MPRIGPPKYEEPELSEAQIDYKRVIDYLNVEPWKCKDCGTMMFGRAKFCAYCRYRLGKTGERQ